MESGFIHILCISFDFPLAERSIWIDDDQFGGGYPMQHTNWLWKSERRLLAFVALRAFLLRLTWNCMPSMCLQANCVCNDIVFGVPNIHERLFSAGGQIRLRFLYLRQSHCLVII